MRRKQSGAGMLAVLVTAGAFLAEAAPSAAQVPSGGAIVVSPAVAEFSLTPGQSFSDQISVENRTPDPLKIFASTGNIEPSGNGFDYRPPGQSSVSSAAAWISLSPSTLEVPAGSTTTVTATIRVPPGTPVGGHYAGVQFGAAITTAEGTRSLQAVHAMLIEVPGVGLTKAGRVLGVTMPRIEIDGEVPFTVQVENGGNTHLRVGGTITVRDRLRRRTVDTVPVSAFYVLPGTTSSHTVVWADPPLLALGHARVHLDLLEACTGDAVAACEATTSGVVIHWWVLAGFAAFLLLVRVIIGLFGVRRRRRARRAERAPYRPPSAEPVGAWAANGDVSPVPAASVPSQRPGGVASSQRAARLWENAPAVQTSIALRRANSAIRMLREGAGETGVRVEVALGLLRSVADAPAVARAVEDAYDDAASHGVHREAASLALGLYEVDSARAPEALLRGYAKADRVLAQRIKRALADCDPADLRAHRDLLDALPSSRRQSLPVG